MKEFNITAVIWQEDQVYVSKCPELEVASAGDTPQEALENLKEAVDLYIENAKILGIMDDFTRLSEMSRTSVKLIHSPP